MNRSLPLRQFIGGPLTPLQPLLMALTFLMLVNAGWTSCADAESVPAGHSFFSLSAPDSHGTSVEFSQFRGRVILVANLHLKCGTTPQLVELQAAYEKYHARGFEVLGFPSEDFGAMDERTNREIEHTCKSIYHTTFPIFASSKITGPQKSGVYSFLTTSGPEYFRGEVGFNLEKFLVGRDGQVKERFGSFSGATSLVVTEAIERELDVEAPQQ